MPAFRLFLLTAVVTGMPSAGTRAEGPAAPSRALGPRSDDEGSRRASPPTTQQQEASEKLVRYVFSSQYEQARRDPAKAASLARTLLEEGRKTNDDLSGRYALLREAIVWAQAAGDVRTLCDAADALAAAFTVDAHALKLDGLAPLGKSAALRDEGQASAFSRAIGDLVGDMIERDEFERSTTIARLASAAAQRTQSGDLRKQLLQQGREIATLQKAFEAKERAKEKLATRPDDSDAHLAMGLYLCFVKADWDAGRPHLVKSGDAPLVDAASKDLFAPVDAAAQQAVGDAWQAVGDAWQAVGDAWREVLEGKKASSETRRLLESSPTAEKRVVERTLKWYNAALPQRSGLTRKEIEKNIAELQARLQQSSAVVGGREFTDPCELDRLYEFTSAGKYYTNTRMANEKWIRGNGRGGAVERWYYLVPDGRLYAWSGKTPATGTQIGRLDPEVYAKPALLHEAFDASRGGCR